MYMEKTFKTLLLQNLKTHDLEIGLYYRGLKLYNIYTHINDNPVMTLTYFTARSSLAAHAFKCSKLLVISRVKLAANDQINRKYRFKKNNKKTIIPGLARPCPGAIDMLMTIIFKHLFLLNLLVNQSLI